MGYKTGNIQISQLSATYTATGGAYANVPGLVLTVLKSGKYKTSANFTTRGSAGQQIAVRLAIGGFGIKGTASRCIDSAGTWEQPVNLSAPIKYYAKGTVVSVQAIDVSSSPTVYYGDNGMEGMIRIEEV